jgi:hypothetical protein
LRVEFLDKVVENRHLHSSKLFLSKYKNRRIWDILINWIFLIVSDKWEKKDFFIFIFDKLMKRQAIIPVWPKKHRKYCTLFSYFLFFNKWKRLSQIKKINKAYKIGMLEGLPKCNYLYLEATCQSNIFLISIELRYFKFNFS